MPQYALLVSNTALISYADYNIIVIIIVYLGVCTVWLHAKYCQCNFVTRFVRVISV